jgi:ribosomal-protein-alanine N-acetyltransferase
MTSRGPRGPVLETERLKGRPLAGRHLADLHKIFADPEVTRTLGGVRSPEQIQQTFERFDSHWEEHGYGPWFFADARDEFVGYAGLLHTHVDGLDAIELLYALTADHWNRGFASEMAASVLAHAFDGLGIETLVCFTLTTNRASQRVMQKAGFRYVRGITHATLPHVFYQQSRTDWERERLRDGPA